MAATKLWKGCLIVFLVLSGCTGEIWDKQGATQADFDRDSYACEKDTRQSGYFGSGLWAQAAMKDFYDKCMVARGWTARK